MAIAGVTISEAPSASGANFVSVGGTTLADGIHELSAVADQVSARSIAGLSLAEGTATADVFVVVVVANPVVAELSSLADTASPGGEVSGSISETLDLSDLYAASGLWTAVAQPSGLWTVSPESSAAWTPVEPASGSWTKH